MKFLEYLNAKGKMQEKPKTDVVPDYEGPEEKAPEPNETDDLGYKAPKAFKKSPTPYAPKSDIKEKELEKGVAYAGDKDMVVKFPELGKMSNEQFINTTKDLSTEDFIKVMNEHCGCEKKSAPMVVAYSSGAYHPDPIQAIRYVSYLTNENENLLRALIHENKKFGGLEKLCERLMDYSEFYEVLKTKIHDKTMFESVKKVIMENSKINEEKDTNHGDENQENEVAEVETEKGESHMKLMKKKSKKK